MKILLHSLFILLLSAEGFGHFAEQNDRPDSDILNKQWISYYSIVNGITMPPYHPTAVRIMTISNDEITITDSEGVILSRAKYLYSEEDQLLTFNYRGDQFQIQFISVSSSTLKTIETDEFGDKTQEIYKL